MISQMCSRARIANSVPVVIRQAFIEALVVDGYRATFATVSHVRVVRSFPNVFWIRVMNTGPFGLGRYALKISRSFMVRMRAPSISRGSLIFAVGRARRNVTMRFALGLSLKAR